MLHSHLTTLTQEIKAILHECIKDNRSPRDCSNLIIIPKWHEAFNCINTARNRINTHQWFQLQTHVVLSVSTAEGVLAHWTYARWAKNPSTIWPQGRSFHAIVSSTSVAHSAIFVLAFQLKHNLSPTAVEPYTVWRSGQDVTALILVCGVSNWTWAR